MQPRDSAVCAGYSWGSNAPPSGSLRAVGPASGPRIASVWALDKGSMYGLALEQPQSAHQGSTAGRTPPEPALSRPSRRWLLLLPIPPAGRPRTSCCKEAIWRLSADSTLPRMRTMVASPARSSSTVLAAAALTMAIRPGMMVAGRQSSAARTHSRRQPCWTESAMQSCRLFPQKSASHVHQLFLLFAALPKSHSLPFFILPKARPATPSMLGQGR